MFTSFDQRNTKKKYKGYMKKKNFIDEERYNVLKKL